MRPLLLFIVLVAATPLAAQNIGTQSDTTLSGVPLGVDEHEYPAGTVTTYRATHVLHLGDTAVDVAEYSRTIEPYSGIRMNMLVLHDDENTAVEAGRRFVSEEGGRIVELRAQGNRRVAFSVDGAPYDLDPNRIFTASGVEATLGSDANVSAASIVRLFGDALLGVYSAGEFVITLHNNTEGQYSARSYLPGGVFEADAADIHIEEGSDPDDFFFVTDPDLFTALKADDFNVVLQNNEAATDDGSLSVWAAQQGFVYVNVEAQHGHLEEQVAMIESLAFLLRMLEHRHHTH
ncbi:MAG: hypothetical protein R3284_08720 [Rubricoccaceae bacterium]|nr:hypothetical protein [Rubricoccaceae bacterium]